MKTYIHYFCLLLGLGLVTSCSEEFLEEYPQDTRTDQNFYASEADATEALVAIYDVLQWNTVVGFHPLPMLADIASDDAYAGGASRTDSPNIIEIDMQTIRPSNGEVYGLWKKNYIGIYRANLFLEKIDGINATEEFKARAIAEAKFLRAWFYADQVRLFGNIPLILETLDPSVTTLPQAEPAVIYNQIALDLTEAMPNLPTALQSDGRITQWAAKALLARVYMFYNGVYGGDLQAGEQAINSNVAVTMLEDVINASGHDLLPVYADIFSRANEFSVESVFEISYSDLLPWYDWGYVQGGEGNIAVQMQGPRVKDPGAESVLAGWSFAPATQDLYEAFAENDPRRDATLLTMEEINGEINVGFQHTGYFNQKYTTVKEYAPTAGQPELNWGNNYRAIRYADVLLMAAELHARNGATAMAQPYLDRVRERVGLDPVPATLENVLQERRVELALEGLRYWDLLRLGIAQQAIAASAKEGPLYLGDEVDYEVSFNAATKGFFPIPQTEIDITNNVLQQNAGY